MISIILPSIRSKNLVRWYDAAEKASKNNEWEVIVVSPYDLPQELDTKRNIKFLKSDRNPTVCKQMGCLLASGEFLFNTTDDALLKENSIDEMIFLWQEKKCNKYDVINARYREGALDVDTLNPINNLPPELPPEYWTAWHHASLRENGVQQNWKISLHFLMKLETFYELGGLVCDIGYEYSVFPILELMFNCQTKGGTIYDSINEVSWCSHLPNNDGDHSPVAAAMAQDEALFHSLWKQTSGNHIIYKNYSSWKNVDFKWSKRFK